MRRIPTAVFAVATLWAGAAAAGEQYVDASGYAVSGYDVVAYFDEDRSPSGEPQPAPTPGKASITAEWNGAVWAFASPGNRERFLADPEAYAPRYDGHCAFGVAKGGKVPGDPQRWRIVDGKLYLNLQQSVQEMWLQDIPGHLAASEANWPGLEDAPATDREVPELAPGSAPTSG